MRIRCIGGGKTRRGSEYIEQDRSGVCYILYMERITYRD